MPVNEDRRIERRRAERVKVDIKARWEGVLEGKEGVIIDLSTSGCFILTAHLVEPRELIRLEIETGLVVWGEVVYQIREMGFALKFTEGIGEEARQLEALVQTAKASKES